jgi:hypothetical protein
MLTIGKDHYLKLVLVPNIYENMDGLISGRKGERKARSKTT